MNKIVCGTITYKSEEYEVWLDKWGRIWIKKPYDPKFPEGTYGGAKDATEALQVAHEMLIRSFGKETE